MLEIRLPNENILHVVVTREPFSDFYLLTFDNGHTEELEIEDCKLWFKEHGANMDTVDKALDYVWNFRRSEINIQNPKEPPVSKHPYAPKL